MSFSGDTCVSFEADSEKLATSYGNTFIQGKSVTMTIDRCSSEALARSMPDATSKEATERILIFPVRDYTQELLSRQFLGDSAAGES
jgi:hypothetical protein